MASSTSQQDDNDNAATWYYRAFEEFDKITREEWEVLEKYRENPNVAPTRHVREILAKAARGMDYIERGSHREYADYNLDYSQGFELLLPHLGSLRAAVKVMSIDAMVKMHDGDGAGAANRVAAMYRTAEHGRDDRVLISSLVGQAIYNMGETTAKAGLDRGVFGPAESARLFEALERYDMDDPFGQVDALMIERELALATMIERFESNDGGDGLAELVEWMAYEPDEKADQLRTMSAEQFEKELQEYDKLMGRYLEIFNMEDREQGLAELKKIEEQLEADEHGLLASLLLPALSRMYELTSEMLEGLHEHRETLEQMAKGEADLREIVNAAMWYHRGITELRKLSNEEREQVLSITAEQAKEPDDDLKDALKTAESALNLFRQAALIRRCDFKPLRGRLIEFVPDYVAGMQEALRFTRGNAKQLLDSNRSNGACERLLIALRMIDHLGGGDSIMGSVVAHAEFNEVTDLILNAIENEQFTPENLALLHRAVVVANAGDPFGYRGAKATTIEELSSHMRYHINVNDASEETRERIESFIERSDGDRLVFLQIVDTEEHNVAKLPDSPRTTPGKNPTDAEKSLYHLISEEVLVTVRSQIHLTNDMLKEGKFVELHGLVNPDLAQVEERQKKARSDCRKAIAAFPRFAAADEEDP